MADTGVGEDNVVYGAKALKIIASPVYLRNQRGATAVMPYAVRARENAPVAVPITWKEMQTIEAPNIFHIGDATKLLSRAVTKALAGWGRAEQELPDL